MSMPWLKIEPSDGGDCYLMNTDTGETQSIDHYEDDYDLWGFVGGELCESDSDDEMPTIRPGGVCQKAIAPRREMKAAARRALSLAEQDSDEEDTKIHLPPQVHRLYSRLQMFSHYGLRALDDKCALKHHLEGSGTAPETYDLPTEGEAFLEAMKADQQEKTAFPRWIFKEAQMSRGRGICLVKDEAHATQLAHGKVRGVAQRYLEPLLLDGHKWDLRLYVLLSSVEPLEVFLFDEGFARLSQNKYSSDLALVEDLSVHLTNSAVSDGRGTSGGDANVMPTSVLWAKLSHAGHDTAKMQGEVRALLSTVFDAVKPALLQERVRNNQTAATEFSLLGVDVIFDSVLKPYLLEINYNPDMTCHAELQKPIKVALVRNTYALIFGRDSLPDDASEDVPLDVDNLSWDPVPRGVGEKPEGQGRFVRIPDLL